MTGKTWWARKELARAVAAEMGINRKAAALAVDAVISGIQERIATGDRVVLRDFGTFTAVERAARPFTDPRTGERGTAPARRVVRFRPASALKRAVNADREG